MSCRAQDGIPRHPEADLRSGGQILGQKSISEILGAVLRPGGLISGLESRFEAWRANLWPGELI